MSPELGVTLPDGAVDHLLTSCWQVTARLNVQGDGFRRGKVMISIKVIYFNGIKWHMVLFPDGARAIWPCRMDGRPIAGAKTRYYRSTRVNSGRQPVSAAA